MSASVLKKIQDIGQKIVSLKAEQEKLQQQIELKIISLLKSEKAFFHDFETLYGAVYEITQKLKDADSSKRNSDNSSVTEIAKWRQLGVERLAKIKNRPSEHKIKIEKVVVAHANS